MSLTYHFLKKRNNYVSNFNFKLYKRFLTLKLLNSVSNLKFSNLIYLNPQVKTKTTFTLNIYKRSNKIPLRILRYILYLNTPKILNLNLKNIITNKILVHNGKKLKPINIFKNNITLLIKCQFKFGDLILTRTFHIYKKKK